MKRGNRVLAGALSLMLVSVVVTACAPAVDAAWSPPQWPAALIEVVEAPPEPLDDGSLLGLAEQRLRNDGVGVQARFAYLPGTGPTVAPFNERVDAVVRGAIDARSAAVGVAYRPAVFPAGAGLGDRGCVAGSTVRPAADLLADPSVGPPGGGGTTIACDIVAAAGTIAGVRLRVVTGGPGGIQSDDSTILYADTATGAVASGSELWADGAAAALGADIVDALRRDAGALSFTPSDASGEALFAILDASLSTTLPAPDGAFVITIASGFTTPELTELGLRATESAMTVRIPRETAEPFVSDMGRALLAAAGQLYTGPADVPAGADRLDCSLVPCVALTYDDGPSDLTPGILDAARDHDASVTFFVLGSKVAAFGDTARRSIAEGHLIENHTWNHPALPTLPADRVHAQIRDTNNAILEQTGVPATMFRPPYGEYNADVLAAAGMPAILWDIDTNDWRGPADGDLVRHAVDAPHPGSIVLQHDVQANTGRTAAAIYEGLADRGFALANLNQIFGGQPPTSGAWRSAR